MATNEHPARIYAMRKLIEFKAPAMAEKWSARKLAEKSGCSFNFCREVLTEWHGQRASLLQAENVKTDSLLVEVARNARERELRAHPRLTALLEKLERQLALSDDLDAGELDKLVKIKRTYFQHVETLTGLDVIKQSAIRRLANDDKSPPVWSGILEIDVTAERIMPAAQDHSIDDIL